MNVFDDLQKTAEEGAERWEQIEVLATELETIEKPAVIVQLLLALVEYMRPMAPSKDKLKNATGDLENMLVDLVGKMNV